jgi:hypothetical protein
MRDWESKLNDLLTLSGHEILEHQGKITRAQANEKAALKYEIFHRNRINAPSQVEKDFEDATRLINTTKAKQKHIQK